MIHYLTVITSLIRSAAHLILSRRPLGLVVRPPSHLSSLIPRSQAYSCPLYRTIIGDSPHPAFVHVTDDTILRAPSAAQSVCASEPSAPLPLPSGHAHPRDYLRSSVSSGRLLQLPPLPPTAPIGKLL